MSQNTTDILHLDSYSHYRVPDALFIFPVVHPMQYAWNKTCRATTGIVNNAQSVSQIQKTGSQNYKFFNPRSWDEEIDPGIAITTIDSERNWYHLTHTLILRGEEKKRGKKREGEERRRKGDKGKRGRGKSSSSSSSSSCVDSWGTLRWLPTMWTFICTLPHLSPAVQLPICCIQVFRERPGDLCQFIPGSSVKRFHQATFLAECEIFNFVDVGRRKCTASLRGWPLVHYLSNDLILPVMSIFLFKSFISLISNCLSIVQKHFTQTWGSITLADANFLSNVCVFNGKTYNLQTRKYDVSMPKILAFTQMEY